MVAARSSHHPDPPGRAPARPAVDSCRAWRQAPARPRMGCDPIPQKAPVYHPNLLISRGGRKAGGLRNWDRRREAGEAESAQQPPPVPPLIIPGISSIIANRPRYTPGGYFMSRRRIFHVGLVAAVAVACLFVGYSAGAQEIPAKGTPNSFQPGQIWRVGDQIVTSDQLVARIWDTQLMLKPAERTFDRELAYLRDTALLP